MGHAKTLLATSHGSPIAVEVQNTFRLATVALAQVAVTPFRVSEPERELELDIIPISGAYVACIQRTMGGHAASPLLLVRWGRTNDLGWILEPTEAALYDEVPRATFLQGQTLFGEPVGDDMAVPAKEQMLLDQGETYDLYWSFDRERFDQVREQLEKNPVDKPEGLDCQTLEFTARGPYLIPELKLLDEKLRKRVSHFLVRNNDRGFVVGHQYGQDVCIFDVTPEPLRALYLCEFLQYWSIKATKASGKELASLVRARNLAEAAFHGSPDVGMEGHFHAEPGSPEREVLDHYRDYVWQCAANGVNRAQLHDSLSVYATNMRNLPAQEWHQAADQIGRRTKGKAVHPFFCELAREQAADGTGRDTKAEAVPPVRRFSREWLILSQDACGLLLDYFDLYTFGGRLMRRGTAKRITAALEELQSSASENSVVITSLLSKHAVYPAFMDALHCGTPDDSALRFELHARYLTVCADVRHAWWDALEPYKEDDWKALAKRLKWMSTMAGGFGEAFKKFFEHQLSAYELAFEKANQALTLFYRYHGASIGRVHGPIYTEELPTLRTKVRVNFRDNTITVLKAFDGTNHLSSPIKFVFTTIEQPVSASGLAPPPGNMTRARKRQLNFAAKTGTVIEYDVEVPVDIERASALGAKVPAVLGLACGTLNAFFGTMGAVGELKRGVKLERQNIEAWYELGKNTLALVDSLVTLQDAMAPKVEGYSPLLKRLSSGVARASRSVLVVDAAYSTFQGLELLISDDGAVAYELRQGRTVRATTLQVQGFLQVATGISAGAMVLGGAAATAFLGAAAAPVGIAIVVGGVAVAAIDGVLDLTREFGEQVSALEVELDSAERKELPPNQTSALATSRVRRVQELAQRARFA